MTNPPRLRIGPWLHSFFDPASTARPLREPGKYPKDSTVGVLTQKVRGFKHQEHNQEQWMAGWKATIEGKKLYYIALRETHVDSQAVADGLANKWSRQWGRHHDPRRPLSFWTTTATKTGGVAILLHPRALENDWHGDDGDEGDGRCLIIENQTSRIINVYSPNKRGDRENFYQWMEQRMGHSSKRTILVGDFNGVLDSSTDRVVAGRWGPHRNESPALQNLLEQHDLVDVLELCGQPRAPLTTLTYWQGDSGARLDRCYITRADSKWIISSELLVPHQQTDHSGVVAWIRDPSISQIRHPVEPSLYPIKGRDQDSISRTIGQAVGATVTTAAKLQVPWDDMVLMLKVALRRIRQSDRKRARRQRKRQEHRARRNIRTLKDLIAYVQSRVERKANIRRQEHILEKSGNSAALFRRFTQIEQRRDVPQLASTAETFETEGHNTSADVMAEAWRPLFEQRHATVPSEDLPKACAALFHVPSKHVLSTTEGDRLLRHVTEEEVLAAIGGLGAHKAAGPDRISNDFYKDWGSLLAPRLTIMFNALLDGDDPPPSFAEATIVPIPKAGDRTDALNYRPISLLQSGYKIFTKLLANRVQERLGKVINADQNGFVRGRTLADNITLIRAILQQAQEPDRPPSHGAIVSIDFRKAYDTIDRRFVWYALRAFGYPTRFIDVVARMHEGTNARFLVNGDLSKSFDNVTGIRQGCPLAPLLFLIAAETLKHALDQDPQIVGIRLRGHHHDHIHSFSAFVDDSVVYLDNRAMITHVEAVLERFAAVSGLHAQPHKSHAIVLGRDYKAPTLGFFPVVPWGQTVTYLGTEIGIADLNEANWSKRVEAVESQLGILSQYTTGIDDRITVINFASIPNILFTAQFFTPSEATQRRIDGMWRQYIWHGTLTSQVSSPAH